MTNPEKNYADPMEEVLAVTAAVHALAGHPRLLVPWNPDQEETYTPGVRGIVDLLRRLNAGRRDAGISAYRFFRMNRTARAAFAARYGFRTVEVEYGRMYVERMVESRKWHRVSKLLGRAHRNDRTARGSSRRH